MFKETQGYLSIFLWVWFLVSFLLLVLIGWNYLRASVYEAGVQVGVQQGVQSGIERGAREASAQIYTDIINKSANEQCNTVFVQYDGRRVDLVNVQCLQNLQQQNNQNGADENANRG